MSGKRNQGASASLPNTYERTGALESQNVPLHEPVQDVDIAKAVESGSGIALPDARGIEVEPPTGNISKALAEERFFNQVLSVTFPEPEDPNSHQFVEGGVNGEKFCFARDGQVVDCKRSWLAVIASAKTQRVTQKKVTAADGFVSFEEKFTLHPLYPFNVLHDPAGQAGSSWLRQIISGRA